MARALLEIWERLDLRIQGIILRRYFFYTSKKYSGHGSNVVKVSGDVAGLEMSSSPVPLETRRVGEKCTLNLSRAQTSSHWCAVVVHVPVQVSSMLLDHDSKLRGPSQKALVLLNSATLIFIHSL
ncbi:hypothetical protein TNCV_1951941 [Trichonephila clavipes]|nr:hypothetical protein TNCV_1951941 [Trichonephila clavipes]